MITDIHTHYLNLESHCDPQVKADMARCGVDAESWASAEREHTTATSAAGCAVVFGIQAAATGWNVPNDVVAEYVGRSPDRLIFFASIDPGSDGFMYELEKCHLGLGCKGVKLGPVYQGLHPLDKRYYEIYRYCQQRSLPIITHMATTFSSGVPMEFARPIHMDQAAVDFPDLKIVLAHMGHPWENETIAVIRKQANVFADTSALYCRPWQFYNTIRLAVEYGAESKLLFGSDFPTATTADSIAGLRNVNEVLAQSGLPPVPASVVEDILHRDSLGLLGIPRPAST
jgi:uncharacterized protein